MILRHGYFIIAFIFVVFISPVFLSGCQIGENKNITGEKNDFSKESHEKLQKDENIRLPSIETIEDKKLEESDKQLTVSEAIKERRSIRNYEEGEIKLWELSSLLWAAQGITEQDRGFRTAPSAGATYPMEVYAVVGEVKDLKPGLYKYFPDEHELTLVATGDFRDDLMDLALGQEPVGEAPLSLVITSVYERVMSRYGDRGVRYAKMEAGHISQNVYLKSAVLQLGTVTIGAFEDEKISNLLDLKEGEEPLYLMPVGRK